eukprot:2603521-Rhodomonas_salina.2
MGLYLFRLLGDLGDPCRVLRLCWHVKVGHELQHFRVEGHVLGEGERERERGRGKVEGERGVEVERER